MLQGPQTDEPSFVAMHFMTPQPGPPVVQGPPPAARLQAWAWPSQQAQPGFTPTIEHLGVAEGSKIVSAHSGRRAFGRPPLMLFRQSVLLTTDMGRMVSLRKAGEVMLAAGTAFGIGADMQPLHLACVSSDARHLRTPHPDALVQGKPVAGSHACACPSKHSQVVAWSPVMRHIGAADGSNWVSAQSGRRAFGKPALMLFRQSVLVVTDNGKMVSLRNGGGGGSALATAAPTTPATTMVAPTRVSLFIQHPGSLPIDSETPFSEPATWRTRARK